MFLKGLFFCYQLAFAGFCGLAGMILSILPVAIIYFGFELLGLHDYYSENIALFLEAVFGLIFFLGGYNIADKARTFLFKRFL